MESRTLPLPADLRWRRLIVIGLFLGLIYLFRSLAPVFICFVILERSLGFLGDQIERRTPLSKTRAIAAVLAVFAGAIGVAGFFLVQRTLPLARHLRENGRDYLRALVEHPQIEQLRQMTGLENEQLTQAVKEHAGQAISYATETAYIIIFLLIGFVIALLYLFERDEIDEFYAAIPRASVHGTLLRWFGYVADAISITVRMQVVVAIVNAVVTLPVLLFLRLPNIPLLFLLILVTGLLPVVGNVISGAVLIYVAYVTHGWWAVGVFVGTTFLLGKIESYYLSPRLSREHVKLPSLVLVISLLLFEQLFGFVGLFLSFPALYVASRIANEWRAEAEAVERTGDRTVAVEGVVEGAVPMVAPREEAARATSEVTAPVEPPGAETSAVRSRDPAEPKPRKRRRKKRVAGEV
jgi:predicted PurR-regulated permease PerM